MSDDTKLPALRALDITPFKDDDDDLCFRLHDMLGVSPASLVISGAGYFVLAHLDGEHTVTDIQGAFRTQTGHELPGREIERVVEVLDHYAMLETPRFAEACAAASEAYRAAPSRDGRDRWPSADGLRREIEELLGESEGVSVGSPRGIVAPHLDYHRGRPCYAAAYAALAQAAPAERYVILGTNHFGRSASAVATMKDFQTPLGLTRTDRAFIRALEERLGVEICADELDHRAEHSVELQLHILQVCRAEHDFEIVPILCPDVCGPTGTAPANGNGPDLAAFAEALATVLGEDSRPTLLIAAADLSHVGQHFGDVEPSTPAFLAEVERGDRRLLSAFRADREDEAIGELRASQNPTRICSAGCIYVLRRALRGRPWHTLQYHQAVDTETDTIVTCAAAAIC